MPYQFCESCQTRYYVRPDGKRPHICGKQSRRSRRQPEFVGVSCEWTGCHRGFHLEKVGKLYRLEPEWGSALIGHPICPYHRQLLRSTFGADYRMNGIKNALRGLDDDLRLTGPCGTLMRLVILDLAQHRCEDCSVPLSYDGWPNKWHVDHRLAQMNGGADTLRNLRPLCTACDRVKTSQEQAIAMRALGQSNAGKTLTPEHKHKISEASQRYWDNVPQAEKLAHGRKSVWARKKNR